MGFKHPKLGFNDWGEIQPLNKHGDSMGFRFFSMGFNHEQQGWNGIYWGFITLGDGRLTGHITNDSGGMNDAMGSIGNRIWDTIGYNGNMPFGAIKHGGSFMRNLQ